MSIVPPPIHPSMTASPEWADRFWSKVTPAESGCWLWVSGPIDGYGIINRSPWGTARPHRVAYMWVFGVIPSGLVIDHLCHNADLSCVGGDSCIHRRCVNPEHLEAVTHRVNILRGRGTAAQHASALTCKYGHPLTPDNLTRAAAVRQCRECQNRRVREYYYRQKEKAAQALGALA